MRKKLSVVKRMLAFVLTFAMAFTAISWGDVGEVKADVEETNLLTNGDFETKGEEALLPWENSEKLSTQKVIDTKSGVDSYGFVYNYYHDNAFTNILSQPVALEAGSYKVEFETEGTGAVYSYFNNKIGTEAVSAVGWGNWTTGGSSTVFVLDEAATVNVGVYITGNAKDWGEIDNIVLTKVEGDESNTQNLPTEDDEPEFTIPEETVDHTTDVEAKITVNKISDLPKDFIEGVDVSSYIAQKNSGVKYYDFDGTELTDQGFFDLLHDCGVNYVRIRIWNDPYDAAGHGYGGGNNDVDKAIKIGQWATNAGMKVLIDFHYSDFWTDPGKQFVPKAWSEYSLDQKATAIAKFTTESLNQILDAGVNVGMVQVGNETNAYFCGEKDWTSICKLFSAGCNAVREVSKAKGKSILIALHFADPQKKQYDAYAAQLDSNGVDYDVFASSYYPFFHGTTDNLTMELHAIAEKYNKKVMVAETSWATTLNDGDGHDNQIREGNNDTRYYDFSAQGQATEVRTVMRAVANVGDAGIGVFYWEPAWIPVQYAYDANGNQITSIVNSNKNAWQTYGSGWATSYGGEFQEDAAIWWGGSAMDNQAMFDMTGHPLESLKVFNYVKTGAHVSDTNVEITSVSVENTLIEEGDEVTLNKALVALNDGSDPTTVEVEWNQAQIEAAVAKGIGAYEISGIVKVNVKGTVISENVKTKLTIVAKNFMPNASFETEDNAWITTGMAITAAENDSRTGSHCMKYWLEDGGNNIATRKLTLEEGHYNFGAYTMGGDAGDAANFTLQVKVNGKAYSAQAGKLLGWNNWLNPEIKNVAVPADAEIELSLIGENIAAGGWGAWDDLYVNKYVAPASQPPVIDSGSGSGSVAAGGSTQDKTDTAVTKNPDGTTTETKTETTTNESGKEVATTVTTKKDAGGKVTGSTEVSTIAGAAKDTAVTVTVEKDAKGNVAEAVAEVTKKGTETEEGTKGTISAAVVQQIKEAAGSANVAITTSVTGADGKEKYSVTVDANDLVAGAKLTVVVKDAKTGKAVLVDAKQVKVTAKGNVSVVLPEGNDYTLIDAKEAAKVTKEILKTVAPAKTSATLKAGKTNTAKLSKKLDMDNVKKITYTTSKKGVVTVNKNGKVVAKKAGTATITIKVTLNNGKTKTVKMKYTVK